MALPEVWLTQLPRPFSRPPQLEMDLSEVIGHYVSRLEPPEDGLPRPHQNPNVLLPIPCKSRSSIPMAGETEEVCKWMDWYNPRPFMLASIQGHLLHFNQKPPLVKPICKCEVNIPETQENMMTSEVRSMLSQGTIDVGPGNKGFLHMPF